MIALWKISRGCATALGTALLVAMTGSAHAQGERISPATVTFRTFALSESTRSLIDDTERTNRELTGQTGDGLVELVTSKPAEGLARIRSRALRFEISVPLGWHVVEDSERLAMFNPSRSVRLICWRVDLAFEGVEDVDKFFVAKGAALRTRYPGIRASSETLADGDRIGLFENVPARKGDKETRVVVDVLTPGKSNVKVAFLMTFGAPASEAEKYLPLLGLIRQSREIKW